LKTGIELNTRTMPTALANPTSALELTQNVSQVQAVQRLRFEVFNLDSAKAGPIA
jgi:hypothetical protein